MKLIKITDEMVEAYDKGWSSTPPGAPGFRRRAGLVAALAVAPVEDALLAYSEWLDADQRLVGRRKPSDMRSHEELVAAFLEEKA